MDSLATRVPPPVIAFVIGALMWADARFLGGLGFDGLGFDLAALLLALAGLGLAAAGGREFARARTTYDPHRIDDTSALVTTGPYRFTRNPMYLGLLGVLVALGLVLGELISLVFGSLLFVIVITVLQIRPEERILAAKFGAAFDDYRSRVRRWI